MKGTQLGPATFARVRDYVIAEQTFTIPYAAWCLELSVSAVRTAFDPLLRNGIIRELEPREGPYAAVFEYVPPPKGAKYERRWLSIVDDDEARADLAPKRGEQIAHTGTEGPSGRPGRDRKRQERGVRVKRQRNGT